MFRALSLLLTLCVLGVSAVRASDVTPHPTDTGLRWKDIDQLIADAKHAMMADPNVALSNARKAVAMAETLPASSRQDQEIASGLWLEGEAFTRTNKVTEARAAIDRAIKLASKSRKLSKLDGDLQLSLARVADSTDDIALALKSYHRAHDIFSALGEARGTALSLMGLGNIYDEAHDLDHESRYYRDALKVYPGDRALELSAANNVGFALQQAGRYDNALKNFRRALELSTELKSTFLQARILTNIAAVYAKLHQFSNAEDAANQALKLLGKNDENGWAPFVWGVKAENEYERGALDAAVHDLDRTFRGVDLTKTIAPFRDIHQVAYKVYRATGNSALALAHLEAFERLDDEGRSLAASANLALLGTQFDFANQQLEIQHLESDQLRRNIVLRESQAAMQTAIFGVMALAGFVLWIFWRHLVLRRHRNTITSANIALTSSLAERDLEIERRAAIESQLRMAIETAKEANRTKSKFLANMSHELRTPLNAIIGFSDIMASGILGIEAPPKYVGYAKDINGSGQHLLAILNDILDMSRIDAGKEQLDEADLSLSQVVAGVVAMFEGAGRCAGKTIRKLGTAEDIWVRGDERRLRQVLINLISNAIKFTDMNGVIEVRADLVPDGVDLTVSDNGMGIPEDKLAEVMEPFGQAHSAYDRAQGGIGLGLPIVKSLVELHGGRFSISSTLNQGTTVLVHLPSERILRAEGQAAALAMVS